MKAGWQETTLGAAFTTVTGNTPPKNDSSLFGAFLPLVKPPELVDATLDSAEDGLSEAGAKLARTAPPNSILVSCIGNLGKVGLNTVTVAFNQQINAILPDATRVLPEFMFYQACPARSRAAHGAGIRNHGFDSKQIKVQQHCDRFARAARAAADRRHPRRGI